MALHDSVTVGQVSKVKVFIETENGDTYVLNCPGAAHMEVSTSWDQPGGYVDGYGPQVLAYSSPILDRVTLSFRATGPKPMTTYVNPTQATLFQMDMD